MSDSQSSNTTQEMLLAKIVLVSLEEDDFETLSTIEDVRMEIWEEISTLEEYLFRLTSDNKRDAGVILILGEIAREVISQKDLVKALFQAGTTAVGALAKQGHVKKIEMILDSDSITIEDADRVTVQRLIDMFEAKHPGKTSNLTTTSSIQIIGTVSKAEEPSKS